MATKKKVVKSETQVTSNETVGADWKPTPEAKKKATTKRIIAGVLWALAIGLEAFCIFWVLKQFGDDGEPIFGSTNGTGALILLIALIVVIGVLALVGSLQWKQANRLDPASRKNKARFFVQNQLGAIITVIAFVPLIVMIFLNKDMDAKQKGIAGGIGIVICLVVGLLSVDWDPVSTEDMSFDDAVVAALHDAPTAAGIDVYWVKNGSVYHLCEDVSDVNRDSADGTISFGTIDQARAEGKARLTKKWESEAKTCGFSAEAIANAQAVASGQPTPVTTDTTEPEPSPTES
ncbi:MAG: hypothetical protein LBR20_00405 [Propionibacteriaceae bacterium]|jgi:FtsH-binding integral membrane protein|nr:hypothetical protein [Propionibacteriaceae bacterium]